MARQSRLILPQQPHLVLHRGNDNQLIFRDDEDFEQLRGWLKEAARAYKVAVHAYVFLPTHLQLLVTPSDETGLALMMQKLGRLYVPWFNQKYQRSGTLFQGRFRTSLVETDKYFLACSRFIELAPVRGQLAVEAGDYPWSSYRHRVGVRPDATVSDHSLYWGLGNTPFQREAAYMEYVQQGIADDELKHIEQAIAKGWPIATQAFKLDLERKTQRRILPAKRGRPFKKTSPAESGAATA
jgi:putative transposase